MKSSQVGPESSGLKPDRKPSRKPYEKPVVRSEKMFETNALACGKCASGPVSQYACGNLLANS